MKNIKINKSEIIEFCDYLRIPKDFRLKLAQKTFKKTEFYRKEYNSLFANMSTATATRDLRHGVNIDVLHKTGKNALTKYVFVI